MHRKMDTHRGIHLFKSIFYYADAFPQSKTIVLEP